MFQGGKLNGLGKIRSPVCDDECRKRCVLPSLHGWVFEGKFRNNVLMGFGRRTSPENWVRRREATPPGLTRPRPPTYPPPAARLLRISTIGRGGRVRRRKAARPRTTSFAPRMGRPNRVLTAPLPLFDVVAGRQSPNLTSAHLACCGVYPGLGGRVRRWKAGSRHDGWGALGFHVCLARVQDCREVCPSAV